MNARVARACATLVAVLSLSGCLLGVEMEPKDDPETKAKYPDVVSADVGGVPWSARVNETWFESIDLTLNAIGGRTPANYLAFRVRGVNKVGTYPIGGFAPPYVSVELEQNSVIYTHTTAASIGTMTITELTPTRVSGTFSFTAPRATPITPGGMTNERTSMPVTNGTFSIAIYPAYSWSIAP